MILIILVCILIAIFIFSAKTYSAGGRMYKVFSTNENKIREYKRMGLKDAEFGEKYEVKEVKGTPMEVIIYKAKAMPKDSIAEDTSLDIEGSDVGVMVKYKLDELPNMTGKNAVWTVLLGYNDGENIKIYEGKIKGKIVEKRGEKGFDFDFFFQPDGSDKTLSQLEEEGKKDEFSARKEAIKNLLADKAVENKNIVDILEWTGEYQ